MKPSSALLLCWMIVQYGVSGNLYQASNQNINSIWTLLTEIPSDTTGLDVSGNKVQQLSDNELSTLTQLQSLIIANNQLKDMSPNCFEGTHLESLDSSINKLTVFPNLTVVGSSLKELDLSVNSISEVQCKLLQVLTALQKLYLSHNQISVVPAPCVYVALSLDTLDMTGNKLTAVSDIPFLGMENSLKKIYMSANHLGVIVASLFEHLPLSTKDLEFENCGISDRDLLNINVTYSIGDFQLLSLYNNTLNTFPLISKNISNFVRELDLRYNYITDLPRFVLDDYLGLKYFRLTNNRLISLPQLTQLSAHPLLRLYVSDNLIQTISPDIFHGITSLQNFYADKNVIAPEGAVWFPESLINIQITNNQWSVLDITNLSNVEFLYVGQNNLNCLQGDFTRLRKLKRFAITSNPLQNCSFQWLSGLTSLKRVILNIANLVDFPNVTLSRNTLLELNVAFNDIEEIRPSLLEGFGCLKKIRVRGNSLQVLPPIRDSPVVQLYADQNQLKHFPDLSGQMNNTLENLYLHVNQIEIISIQEIHMLQALKVLTLNDNKICAITDLSIMSSIVSVTLDNNLFLCDCHLSWVKKVSFVSMSPTPCAYPSSFQAQNWVDIEIHVLEENCPNDTLSCPLMIERQSLAPITTSARFSVDYSTVPLTVTVGQNDKDIYTGMAYVTTSNDGKASQKYLYI